MVMDYDYVHIEFFFAWWEKAQNNTEQISKQQQHQFFYTRLAIFKDKIIEQKYSFYFHNFEPESMEPNGSFNWRWNRIRMLTLKWTRMNENLQK